MSIVSLFLTSSLWLLPPEIQNLCRSSRRRLPGKLPSSNLSLQQRQCEKTSNSHRRPSPLHPSSSGDAIRYAPCSLRWQSSRRLLEPRRQEDHDRRSPCLSPRFLPHGRLPVFPEGGFAPSSP